MSSARCASRRVVSDSGESVVLSRAARRPRKPDDYALYRGADRAAREAEGHGALVKTRVRLGAEHRVTPVKLKAYRDVGEVYVFALEEASLSHRTTVAKFAWVERGALARLYDNVRAAAARTLLLSRRRRRDG